MTMKKTLSADEIRVGMVLRLPIRDCEVYDHGFPQMFYWKIGVVTGVMDAKFAVCLLGVCLPAPRTQFDDRTPTHETRLGELLISYDALNRKCDGELIRVLDARDMTLLHVTLAPDSQPMRHVMDQLTERQRLVQAQIDMVMRATNQANMFFEHLRTVQASAEP